MEKTQNTEREGEHDLVRTQLEILDEYVIGSDYEWREPRPISDFRDIIDTSANEIIKSPKYIDSQTPHQDKYIISSLLEAHVRDIQEIGSPRYNSELLTETSHDKWKRRGYFGAGLVGAALLGVETNNLITHAYFTAEGIPHNMWFTKIDLGLLDNGYQILRYMTHSLDKIDFSNSSILRTIGSFTGDVLASIAVPILAFKTLKNKHKSSIEKKKREKRKNLRQIELPLRRESLIEDLSS
jgi:hypothetical protein